jgi:hypothetical protein
MVPPVIKFKPLQLRKRAKKAPPVVEKLQVVEMVTQVVETVAKN